MVVDSLDYYPPYGRISSRGTNPGEYKGNIKMAWCITEVTHFGHGPVPRVEGVNVVGPFKTKEAAFDFYFGEGNSSMRTLAEADERLTINEMDIAIVEMQTPLVG
jgi:hypothetical protein